MCFTFHSSCFYIYFSALRAARTFRQALRDIFTKCITKYMFAMYYEI